MGSLTLDSQRHRTVSRLVFQGSSRRCDIREHDVVNGDVSRARDPFYTTKTYGTGMGLTLVEQILKQHNASFSLTANDDQGMTARVTFPRD